MLCLNFYTKFNCKSCCRKENCFHLNFYFIVNLSKKIIQKMNQVLKFTHFPQKIVDKSDFQEHKFTVVNF